MIVLAVSEIQSRSVDRELVELAHQENRIVLTEDKDFRLAGVRSTSRLTWSRSHPLPGLGSRDIGGYG